MIKPLYAALMFAVLVSISFAEACNTTITENTTLTGDISCSGAGNHGINIGAHGITLDCAGHNINGSLVDSTYGVRMVSYKNLTIKNCNITSFDKGIYGTGLSQNNTILNNTISNMNTQGIVLWGGFACLIENNSIIHSQYNIQLTSTNNTIVRNNYLSDAGGANKIDVYLGSASSYNNSFYNNTFNSTRCVRIFNSNDNHFYGNHFYNGSGYFINITNGTGNTFNYSISANITPITITPTTTLYCHFSAYNDTYPHYFNATLEWSNDSSVLLTENLEDLAFGTSYIYKLPWNYTRSNDNITCLVTYVYEGGESVAGSDTATVQPIGGSTSFEYSGDLITDVIIDFTTGWLDLLLGVFVLGVVFMVSPTLSATALGCAVVYFSLYAILGNVTFIYLTLLGVIVGVLLKYTGM